MFFISLFIKCIFKRRCCRYSVYGGSFERLIWIIWLNYC